MNARPKSALETVFPRVMEEMAFLFAEPPEATEQYDAPQDAVCASIAFTGARNGTLSMAVSTRLGHEISVNLLGDEPTEPLSDSAAHDALGELLNVTCGNVLTELAGEKPVFNLSVPRVTAMNADEWKTFLASTDASVFVVDGYLVLARIHVDD